MFRAIRLSFECMASAKWPEARHDGDEWRAEDNNRLKKAGGELLSMPAALIYIKAIGVNTAALLGFPKWQSQMRSCLFCAAYKEEI